MQQDRSLRARVEDALATAPPIDCSSATRIEEDGADALTELSILRSRSDLTRVTIDQQPNQGPGVVVVTTLGELGEAKRIYRSLVSREGFGTPELTANDIGLLVHEAEHGAAALQLGARRIAYSLSLACDTSNGQRAFATQLALVLCKVKTTKLGLAAIVAAPRELSPGDREDLTAMGYAGVGDVAERVERFNAGHRKQMPLPASMPSRPLPLMLEFAL